MLTTLIVIIILIKLKSWISGSTYDNNHKSEAIKNLVKIQIEKIVGILKNEKNTLIILKVLSLILGFAYSLIRFLFVGEKSEEMVLMVNNDIVMILLPIVFIVVLPRVFPMTTEKYIVFLSGYFAGIILFSGAYLFYDLLL